MDDLIEFLRARLDEDEQVARKATARQRDGEHWLYGHEGGVRTKGGLGVSRRAVPVHGEHIARHDPARILSEVDAKRQILTLCEPPLVDVRGPGDSEPQFVPGEGAPWGDDVLRLLALPYADHPNYRPEWRPDAEADDYEPGEYRLSTRDLS